MFSLNSTAAIAGDSPQREAARRLRYAGITATCIASALIAGGILFTLAHRAELRAQLQGRVPEAADTIQVTALRMQMLAQLAAANDLLNRPIPGPPSKTRLELMLLTPTATGYVVTRDDAMPDVRVKREGQVFSKSLAAASSGPKALLWPPERPEMLMYCTPAETPRLACASVNLQALLDDIANSRLHLIAFNITDAAGHELARTPDWPGDPSRFTESVNIQFDGFTLTMNGRADPQLRRAYGTTAGTTFSAAVFFLYLVFIASLGVRYKTTLRQLALISKIEQNQVESAELIQRTFGDLADATGMLVWILYEHEQVVLMGPWAQRAGLQKSRLTLSETVARIEGGEDMRQAVLEAFERRTQWSRVFVMEVDGSPVTFQASGSPVHGTDGAFIGMIGICADITEAMRVRTQALQDDAKREAQSRYLQLLANNLAGPSVTIKAAVDALSRKSGPEMDSESKRFVALASSAVKRMSSVVQGTVNLMHLRDSDVLDDVYEADVAPLVSDMARALANRTASARGQTIRVETVSPSESDTPAAYNAFIHKTSLLEVLDVVLTNACLYSPDNSTVHVRLLSEPGWVSIQVEDEGAGMGREELSRLGEAFFRGRTSVGIPGTGLGVALAMERTRHTGATIAFQRSTQQGRGMLVIIKLPRIRPE